MTRIATFHFRTSALPVNKFQEVGHLVDDATFADSDYTQWGEPVQEGEETHSAAYVEEENVKAFINWLIQNGIDFDITDSVDWSAPFGEYTFAHPSGWEKWNSEMDTKRLADFWR